MSSATLWPSYGQRYSRPYYSTYSSPSYYGRYSPRVYLPSAYKKTTKAAPSLTKTVSSLVDEVNSPTTQAVLSYLSEGSGLDNCGEITKAYVNIIASGGSRREAAAAAEEELLVDVAGSCLGGGP